jgi:hypothetical protein
MLLQTLRVNSVTPRPWVPIQTSRREKKPNAESAGNPPISQKLVVTFEMLRVCFLQEREPGLGVPSGFAEFAKQFARVHETPTFTQRTIQKLTEFGGGAIFGGTLTAQMHEHDESFAIAIQTLMKAIQDRIATAIEPSFFGRGPIEGVRAFTPTHMAVSKLFGPSP